LQSAIHSILDLLPEDAPFSDEIWAFGEVCLELAEQIAYHPSVIKLARVMEYIAGSAKVTEFISRVGSLEL
jgi:predicted nicotinamide N-methyase